MLRFSSKRHALGGSSSPSNFTCILLRWENFYVVKSWQNNISRYVDDDPILGRDNAIVQRANRLRYDRSI